MTQAGGNTEQKPTALTQPWYTQRTVLVTIGGIVAAWVPAWLAYIAPIVPGHEQDHSTLLGAAVTAAIGTTFAALGSIFARQGGVEAAAEVGDRAGVLTPEEKTAKAKTEPVSPAGG